ncbi:hypothetical protein ACIBI3_35180 [Actinomadura luteofluorescens]|uniref:hypothetical protein n=1 Tax=Actinomadura luteofluorescens TaxID=46163 RepID=UPI0037B10658
MAIIAVTLAVGGTVLPLIGWAIGAIVTWFLTRWPARQKALTTIVWPLGFGLGAWLLGPGASGSTECTTNGQCTSADLPIALQMALGLTVILTAATLTFLVLHKERQAVT